MKKSKLLISEFDKRKKKNHISVCEKKDYLMRKKIQEKTANKRVKNKGKERKLNSGSTGFISSNILI